MSLRSLQANFLRSLLAILGIIIGVGTVIGAVGAIEGATRELKDSMRRVGSNVLWIQPGGRTVGGRFVGQVAVLEEEDVEEIKANPLVLAAAPEIRVGEQVKFGADNRVSMVVGTTPEFFEVFGYRAAEGQIFRRDAVIGSYRVATVGSELAKELFGDRDPVGETIRVGKQAFEVVAVMEEKGMVGFFNYDDQVYIPVSRARRMYQPRSLTTISVRSVGEKELDDVKGAVAGVLRRKHGLQVGEPDDFTITTPTEMFETFSRIFKIWQGVFFSISGISLVVAGFGIMNIMLVSVTERTREIGVRMAVGAFRMDILVQFLSESSMICIVGCPLGIGCGWLINRIVEKKLAPLEPVMAPKVIALAVGVAIATGIISGLYPAWRASRLDPVEALRYE
jgi:putative ABC transport system permease protein